MTRRFTEAVQKTRPRAHPIATDPRTSVRMRTHSSRSSTKIFPSPVSPAAALWVMAPIADSTNWAFTSISSFTLRRRLPASLWLR